jgi:hypothetical protein
MHARRFGKPDSLAGCLSARRQEDSSRKAAPARFKLCPPRRRRSARHARLSTSAPSAERKFGPSLSRRGRLAAVQRAPSSFGPIWPGWQDNEMAPVWRPGAHQTTSSSGLAAASPASQPLDALMSSKWAARHERRRRAPNCWPAKDLVRGGRFGRYQAAPIWRRFLSAPGLSPGPRVPVGRWARAQVAPAAWRRPEHSHCGAASSGPFRAAYTANDLRQQQQQQQRQRQLQLQRHGAGPVDSARVRVRLLAYN